MLKYVFLNAFDFSILLGFATTWFRIQVGGSPARYLVLWCFVLEYWKSTSEDVDAWSPVIWELNEDALIHSSWSRSGCPGSNVISIRVFSQPMPVWIGSARHRTSGFKFVNFVIAGVAWVRVTVTWYLQFSPRLDKNIERWNASKSLNCCKGSKLDLG